MLVRTAFRNAGSFVDAVRERARTAHPLETAMSAGGAYGSLSHLGRATDLAHHAEQYRHFGGYTYAIIRTIAQRIAGQPFRVARSKIAAPRPGTKTTSPAVLKTVPNFLKSVVPGMEVLESHRLLSVLQQPNPVMTQYALMFTTIASMEITGKGFWWLSQDETRDSIWHLPSSWVEPLHENGELFTRWKVTTPGYVEPIYLPRDEIVYFYHPDPSNPLGALSPMQALARSVVADENIEEAQRRAFANGINPGVAIVVGRLTDAAAGVAGTEPPVLDKRQREQLITAVKRHYRGVLNWDEPLILDGLIKDVKRISNGPREMDFLGSGEATKGRLAQGWGVNPVSMGHVEGATRASSAVADDHLAANVLNPRIEHFSQILTAFVAPRYSKTGERLACYLEMAHAVDPDYNLAVETAMVDRGALSVNEWRLKHGLPPIEGGDVAYVGGAAVPVVTLDDGKAVKRRSKRRSVKPVRSPAKQAIGLWKKAQTRYQARYHAAIAAVLDAMHASVADVLRRSVGHTPVSMTLFERALDEASWAETLRGALKEVVYETCLTGAATELAVYSKSILPPRVQGAVSALAARLLSPARWRGVIAGILARIRDGLQAAREAGEEGLRAAERALSAGLGPAARHNTARELAATESAAALNAGQYASHRELYRLEIISHRRWRSMADDRTRPAHRKAHGQTIAANEDFEIDGYRARFPGDPNLPPELRIRCRCTVEALE